MVDPMAIYDAWAAGAIARLPNGFWTDPTAARAVLEAVLRRKGVELADAPRICRRRWFDDNRLGTLLRHHRRSPYMLLTCLYPGRWSPLDFPEVPKAADLQALTLIGMGLEPDAPQHRRWDQVQRLRRQRQRQTT